MKVLHQNKNKFVYNYTYIELIEYNFNFYMLGNRKCVPKNI